MRRSATSTSPSDVFASSLDETLLWLCSIASPIGEEKALCDAVQARLSKLPLGEQIRRYGDSIVVPVTRSNGAKEPKKGDKGNKKGSEAVPKIALVGHLDTVRTENGPARLDGVRCYGAGAADMKSGLAVMICLAELFRSSLPCDLTLVFYAREEGPFAENELGPVLEQDPELRHVDLAVCLEPSDNRLHVGCNGSIHATLTFEGKTAHSARPWEGENAVMKAAPFLAELAAMEPEPHVIDGHTYRSVLNVTQAKDGGRGRNVVPDVFTVNLNHRFTPDTTPEQAMQRIVDLVKGRAKIDFLDVSPPAKPSTSHPLVKKLIDAGVKSVEPKQAWTDVARFSALGIAAVNFGPGENAQAHQKNESTDLELLHEGFAILRKWLATPLTTSGN